MSSLALRPISRSEFTELLQEIEYRIAAERRWVRRILPELARGNPKVQQRYFRRGQALDDLIMQVTALRRFNLVGVYDPPELAEIIVKRLLPDSRRWSAIGELRKLFDEDRARYGLRYGPRLSLKIARGLYWGRAIAAVLTGGSYGLSKQAQSETKNEEKLHSWAWLQRMLERVGAGLITEFIKRHIGL